MSRKVLILGGGKKRKTSLNTDVELCVIFWLQKDTFDPFNLNELLQELSRKQKEILWERLRHLLKETLMEKPVETWQRVEDAESNDGMEVESAPEMVKKHVK